MGDTSLISGLREKRSDVAGQIVNLRCQVDKRQADLMHIDAVLRLYGLEARGDYKQGAHARALGLLRA